MPCYFEQNPILFQWTKAPTDTPPDTMDSATLKEVKDYTAHTAETVHKSHSVEIPPETIDQIIDTIESGIDAIESGTNTSIFTRSTFLKDLFTYRDQKKALAAYKASDPNTRGKPKRAPAGAAVNPKPGLQAAHSAPKMLLERHNGYCEYDFVVRMLATGKGHPHTVFDKHWERELRVYRRDNPTPDFITASEAYEILVNAALHSGAFDEMEAKTQVALITNDLFFQYAMEPNTPINISHIKAAK